MNFLLTIFMYILKYIRFILSFSKLRNRKIIAKCKEVHEYLTFYRIRSRKNQRILACENTTIISKVIRLLIDFFQRTLKKRYYFCVISRKGNSDACY